MASDVNCPDCGLPYFHSHVSYIHCKCGTKFDRRSGEVIDDEEWGRMWGKP